MASDSRLALHYDRQRVEDQLAAQWLSEMMTSNPSEVMPSSMFSSDWVIIPRMMGAAHALVSEDVGQAAVGQLVLDQTVEPAALGAARAAGGTVGGRDRVVLLQLLLQPAVSGDHTGPVNRSWLPATTALPRTSSMFGIGPADCANAGRSSLTLALMASTNWTIESVAHCAVCVHMP